MGPKGLQEVVDTYMDIKQLESKQKKRHASSVPKMYMTVEGKGMTEFSETLPE